MKGSLILGKIAGIKIQIHWSFTLLLIWVLLSNMKAGGEMTSGLFNVALVLVLFLCVTLHELGHALTAKRFGITTRSITLLPIGGVAALEKMPEKPAEELAVAIAGPAVNIIIALFLWILIPSSYYTGYNAAALENILSEPSWPAFFLYLWVANIALIVFNLIPAFPMDGGRVLRALLGFRMSYAKATNIAAKLGQAVSFLFLIIGLFSNPFLVIIAIFVYFGAFAENQMVQQGAQLKDHVVSEALLTEIHPLLAHTTLEHAIDYMLRGTEKDFIVMDTDKVCGMLLNADIIRNANNPNKMVSELMRSEFPVVSPKDGLLETLNTMRQNGLKFLPVTDNGKLVGAISTENISEFILLRPNLKNL
jgi:Zn-dependent protease